MARCIGSGVCVRSNLRFFYRIRPLRAEKERHETSVDAVGCRVSGRSCPEADHPLRGFPRNVFLAGVPTALPCRGDTGRVPDPGGRKFDRRFPVACLPPACRVGEIRDGHDRRHPGLFGVRPSGAGRAARGGSVLRCTGFRVAMAGSVVWLRVPCSDRSRKGCGGGMGLPPAEHGMVLCRGIGIRSCRCVVAQTGCDRIRYAGREDGSPCSRFVPPPRLSRGPPDLAPQSVSATRGCPRSVRACRFPRRRGI